jgi:HEPN domain-containing protein
MPPDKPSTRTAGEWLRRARSNLSRAKQEKPDDVLFEDLCFDAQQAVEKALKALLVSRGIPFRFVHDIGELLETASRGGMSIPEHLRDAVELTGFAVEARYPGPFEAVSEDEWRRAVRLAEETVAWVDAMMNEDR